MPSPLTPVVITDKNGRITTVHKKTAKASKGKAIPAPKRDFTAEAMDAMNAIYVSDKHSPIAVSNIAYLAEHEPKLLSGIVARCSTEDVVEQRTWASAIQYRREWFSSKNPETVSENLLFCQALMELYPVASRISQAEKQYIPGVIIMMVEKTVENTQFYNGSDWDTIRMAMLSERYVTEEDQHGVIFGLHDRLPEIVEMIPELSKRGRVDQETLEILLDSETTALREGEL